ncbi:unnamed protein product [Ectocarpus sp. 12 AP-2014]
MFLNRKHCTTLSDCVNIYAGAIPAQLGALNKLTWLNLSNNHLSGSILKELGSLTKLTSLNLGNNKLSGPIPKELGSLLNLEKLWLAGNKLTGEKTTPGEIRLVTSANVLAIPRAGPTPPELGKLAALQSLDVTGNQLTGPIPKELGGLTDLRVLGLSNNKLTGTIPEELGSLGKLKALFLTNNQLTALWDHTRSVQDIEQGAAHRASGGLIPSELRGLLDTFDRAGGALADNPWVEPPECIVAKGMESIRCYFEDLYAEPYRVQRSSVKIILLGQEGAGKTSLRQSMKANEATPTTEWKEESTVFADVEPMELEGSSVRVYDCAGQIGYTGLLQMFLTPRSVCVLVCNAEAFGRQRGSESCGQVQEDCRKLEELGVCHWLRSISRRVPDNAVILVATKCDLACGNAGDIGTRMEHACRTWLSSWVRDGMQPVRLEHGVCLTSCYPAAVCEHGKSSTGNRCASGGWACDWRDHRDDHPSPSLLHRLVNTPDGGGSRGAQMVLPRSWDMALTVLEALELGRDPVEMVVHKLAGPGREYVTETAEDKTDVYQGITVEDLEAKWQATVEGLAKGGIAVTNTENALKGALSIREFDGSLVRHETFVFLDVVWLARILKPLLNHKDEETFDGFVNLGGTGDTRITLEDPSDIASWWRLKNEGVLEPRLADAMWRDGLSEYVLPTLLSLDLTFPLANDPAGGLVVLLRLKLDRPERVGKVIDTFCLDQTPAFNANWTDFLGVPPGAIEKVLTRCCSLGGVQIFWRYGVLVHGGLGDQDGHGMFAAVLEYSSADNVLTAQIFGDISFSAAWVALSYVMSAVSLMLLEFPGLRWRGSEVSSAWRHDAPDQEGDSRWTQISGRQQMPTVQCRHQGTWGRSHRSRAHGRHPTEPR